MSIPIKDLLMQYVNDTGYLPTEQTRYFGQDIGKWFWDIIRGPSKRPIRSDIKEMAQQILSQFPTQTKSQAESMLPVLKHYIHTHNDWPPEYMVHCGHHLGQWVHYASVCPHSLPFRCRYELMQLAYQFPAYKKQITKAIDDASNKIWDEHYAEMRIFAESTQGKPSKSNEFANGQNMYDWLSRNIQAATTTKENLTNIPESDPNKYQYPCMSPIHLERMKKIENMCAAYPFLDVQKEDKSKLRGGTRSKLRKEIRSEYMDQKWLNWYNRIKARLDENGAIARSGDDLPLYNWIKQQQKKHRQGILSQDRVELLEQINAFSDSIFEPKNYSIRKVQYYRSPKSIIKWDEVADEYMQFLADKGFKPSEARRNGDPREAYLRRWFNINLSRYKEGTLLPTLVDRFEEIIKATEGVTTWELNMAKFRQYVKEFGHLPMNQAVHNGFSIGMCLAKQKEFARKGLLTDKQVQDLIDLGCFKDQKDLMTRDQKWMYFYGILMRHYEAKRREPSYSEIYEGEEIGLWYYSQLVNYLNNPSKSESNWRKKKMLEYRQLIADLTTIDH